MEFTYLQTTCSRPKLRILMAHGLGQSGSIFQHKTRALERALESKINATNEFRYHELDFFYPDGPLTCRSPDQTTSHLPAVEFRENFCWTPENDNTGDIDPLPGLKKFVSLVELYGPFDGIISFSQGGFAMAIVAALLASPEPILDGVAAAWYRALCKDGSNELIQEPFKFLAAFCAPDVAHPKFNPLWRVPVSTPMLQTIGQYDTLVGEKSSKGLASKFYQSQVVIHRGAHFIPKDKKHIDFAASFITDALLQGSVSNVDIIGYFDSIPLPTLLGDDEDSDSVYSGTSSLATPITPEISDLEYRTRHPSKPVVQLCRKSGVNVIRLRQPRSLSKQGQVVF